jgi:nitrogen fixation NifU-like protein
MFSPTLLDHFEHPRNAGELAGATARVRVENPVCADTLQLALRLEGERVESVRFLAKGCVPVIACASLLTTLVDGRSLHEIALIDAEEVAQRVGGLPAGSFHGAQLAIDALKQALREAATSERGSKAL